MFGPDPAPSKTYLHKVSRTIAERVFICNRIAIESRKKGVDPILALSVGMRESGFTYVTSKKGAQGPLGVLPRYHCKQGAHNCDLIKAGVSALSKFLELNPGSRCKALAQYNRGLKGECAENHSEFYYASDVIEIYNAICSATDFCHDC
jgi:soluble lytic murein transglycosylase-like protein